MREKNTNKESNETKNKYVMKILCENLDSLYEMDMKEIVSIYIKNINSVNLNKKIG